MPRETDFDRIRSWQRVFRDLVIVASGAFMLVYATAFDPTHNPYVIGGGLLALGVPPALRYDQRRNEVE